MQKFIDYNLTIDAALSLIAGVSFRENALDSLTTLIIDGLYCNNSDILTYSEKEEIVAKIAGFVKRTGPFFPIWELLYDAQSKNKKQLEHTTLIISELIIKESRLIIKEKIEEQNRKKEFSEYLTMILKEEFESGLNNQPGFTTDRNALAKIAQKLYDKAK